MAVKIYLHEAIEAVMDAAVTILESEIVTGGTLEGVVQIVRGDRRRTTPEVPAIWVYNEPLTPSNIVALQESWQMPISLVSVVKQDDSVEGFKEATRLAALARSAMLKNRPLGERQYVQDTKSGRFEPAGPWYSSGNLYSAIAQVIVTFRTFEY